MIWKTAEPMTTKTKRAWQWRVSVMNEMTTRRQNQGPGEKTILMQLYLYTYNKFGADRVLVIVLAGSFHLDVYWLFVFWASDCSYFDQKMTPIVPNIFCFATNNSTLTLKPRVKIKDHPTWPLLVTFLAFFSFAFLICGVDGIWNIKWSIQVDILLPFTANNHFP